MKAFIHWEMTSIYESQKCFTQQAFCPGGVQALHWQRSVSHQPFSRHNKKSPLDLELLSLNLLHRDELSDFVAQLIMLGTILSSWLHGCGPMLWHYLAGDRPHQGGSWYINPVVWRLQLKAEEQSAKIMGKGKSHGKSSREQSMHNNLSQQQTRQSRNVMLFVQMIEYSSIHFKGWCLNSNFGQRACPVSFQGNLEFLADILRVPLEVLPGNPASTLTAAKLSAVSQPAQCHDGTGFDKGIAVSRMVTFGGQVDSWW